MPQRDCGCSGLVTPTLDELLAVARAKPLPRVSVRERRPPPANVGASMKGWLSWRLIDRAGREVRGGEGPNLILDQGLNQIATRLLKHNVAGPTPAHGWFPIIGYAAIGTNSAIPAANQTALGGELARTGTTFADDALTRPSDGAYRLTRHIEFGYAVGNGVLTEWGFSYDGIGPGSLFNRALFTDSGGNPDAITKTNQEKLRLTYTLEVALSPVTMTPGAFTIAGVGTVNGDYTLVGAGSPTNPGDQLESPDLYLFSALARGALGVASGSGTRMETAALRARDADLSGVVYTDRLTNVNDTADRVVARDVTDVRDVYTPGSFARAGGSWKFDTAYGNLNPIRGFAVGGAYEAATSPYQVHGYVLGLDPADEFTKDDEHTLTIGVPTVTWGRAP